MTNHPRDRFEAVPPLSDDDLRRWRERVAAAPDLRMARVLRVRREIGAQRYDEESRLERVIQGVHADIAALWREEETEVP